MERGDLPAGWSKAVVGDYFFLKNGFAFKSNDYIPASDNTFPVIRISDLDGKIATDSNAVHVLDGALGFEVRNGDLLIAMSGATTGKIGIYQGKEPAYQNQRVGNLKLHSEVNGCNDYKNYLVYFLSDDILKIAYGGAQPNISGKAIEEMEILLPPLAEQKVIAEKLDTLLAQVDNTKARLERIPEILKRFRQSVLAAAVSGKLTEEWREASSLAFDWSIKKLKDISNDISYGYTASSSCSPNGPKMLRITDIQDNKVDWDSVPYCEIEDKKKGQYLLKCNDLVFARTGATVGKSFLIRDVPPESVYASYLIRVRCNENNSVEYLALFFQSNNYWQQITEFSAGIGQPNVNGSKLKSLNVPIPTLEEQTEIVRRVEELFAFVDRIEHAAQAALSRVNNLAQSILAKAFRGELTADWRAANPELISGDNSAEALLDRIKAERETIKNQPKTKSPAVKKKTGSRMNTQIIKVVEALKQAGEPLSGQQLLAAAGYPSDSSTDQLEQFFLDVREALVTEKSIVKLKRADDGQDWFAIAEPIEKIEEQS